MTSGTTLLLEPIVGWPRVMTPGRPYLVTIDLRMGGGDWPSDEEEFAFTCLLDGSTAFSVEAVHDASVVIHRFGGSYGPAEFIVTPGGEPAGRSLWLSILTERGIMVRTVELPVDVRGVARGSSPTVTRPVDSATPVRQSAPSPAHTDQQRHTTPSASPVADSESAEPSRPERRVFLMADAQFTRRNEMERSELRAWLLEMIKEACRLSGVNPEECLWEDRGDGLWLLLPQGLAAKIIMPMLARRLKVALHAVSAAAPEAGLAIRIVLADGDVIKENSAGYHGDVLIVASRLIGSPILRNLPSRRSDRNLGIAVIRERETEEQEMADEPSQWSWSPAYRLVEIFLQDEEIAGLRLDRIRTWILIPEVGGIPDVGAGAGAETNEQYAVLTLIGHANQLDFLRLVLEHVDDQAEILYRLPDRVAVMIPDPRDTGRSVADLVQREVRTWEPGSEVFFERSAFRPYLLRGLAALGPDGRRYGSYDFPATDRVRHLVETFRPDLDAARVVMTGVDGRLRRLPLVRTLHDAGLRDGDEVRVVSGDLEVGTESTGLVSLEELLSLPDVHLIVDGEAMLGLADSRALSLDRLLSRLAELVESTDVELTCVLDVLDEQEPAVARGVRVLFTAPGGSVHEMMGRLSRAEPPERDVVVVSWEVDDRARESRWRVAPLLLLREIDRLAVRRGETAPPGERQQAPVLRLVFPTGELKVGLGQHLVLGRDAGLSPVAATFTRYGNVSRRHSTVWLDPAGAAWIRDERSTNGTFVNDQRLPPGAETPLRDGDSVRLASDVTGTVQLT